MCYVIYYKLMLSNLSSTLVTTLGRTASNICGRIVYHQVIICIVGHSVGTKFGIKPKEILFYVFMRDFTHHLMDGAGFS